MTYGIFSILLVLDASSHLYKRPLVGRLVHPLVTLSSISMKNSLSRILNDLDRTGRGRKREEEEGGTRRKEGQRGRRDKEEGERRKEE